MELEQCPPRLFEMVLGFLSRISGKKLATSRRLADSTMIVRGKAYEQIYGDNEYHPYMYLVLQGIAQMGSQRGTSEVILQFVGPQEVVGTCGLNALYSEPYSQVPPQMSSLNDELRQHLFGETPNHSAKALTDFLAIRFDMREVARLSELEMDWSRTIATMAIMSMGKYSQRLQRHLLLSPEDQYKLMLDEQPEIVASVQQKNLAQYLGVTPEGLSRISARLRKKAEQNRSQAKSVLLDDELSD